MGNDSELFRKTMLLKETLIWLPIYRECLKIISQRKNEVEVLSDLIKRIEGELKP